MNWQSIKSWLKVLAPMMGSIVALVVVRVLGPDFLNQRTLGEFIRPFGRAAPIAFIAVTAIRPMLLLPGQLFTAVGGVLFGAKWGTIYSLCGDAIAMVIVYGVSRRFGRRLMRRIAKEKYGPLERVTKRHEFKYAVLSTISPLFPTDVAVALAASSGARMAPLLFGVMVATTPGVYLTALFGSSISQGKFIMSVVSGVGMLASLVLGTWLGRNIYREVNEESEKDEKARRRHWLRSRRGSKRQSARQSTVDSRPSAVGSTAILPSEASHAE